MKKYIEMVVNNNRREDMECLEDMMSDLLCNLKEYDYDEFKKYKKKLMGMAYNYRINEELGYDIVKDMKPKGEYWDRETISNVVGSVSNLNDVYVVMNSLVNDYGDIISPDEVDTYVKMTNAWLNDVDGKDNKVWWYFVK